MFLFSLFNITEVDRASLERRYRILLSTTNELQTFKWTYLRAINNLNLEHLTITYISQVLTTFGTFAYTNNVCV